MTTRIPYYTFTIRLFRDSGAPTEFIKRLQALRSGAMLPTFTTQSYVRAPARRGDLLAVGVADTRRLIGAAVAAIEDGSARFRRTTNATFQYLGFDDVEAAWFDPDLGWRDAATGEPWRPRR